VPNFYLTRAYVVEVVVHVHNSNLTRTVIVEMHRHVELWSGSGVGISPEKSLLHSSHGEWMDVFK
jgi:hypothetical protein